MTHIGRYRLKLIPFVLINAPPTFQRAFHIILIVYSCHSFLVYFYDFIILSTSVKYLVSGFDEVLSLIFAAGISLKYSKFYFLKYRVNYLLHVFQPGNIASSDRYSEDARRVHFLTEKAKFKSLLSM